MTHTLKPPVAEPLKLEDVRAVRARLSCSQRHVYRLNDAGLMPKAIKLGALVRWRSDELDQWIADGCPPIRRTGK